MRKLSLILVALAVAGCGAAATPSPTPAAHLIMGSLGARRGPVGGRRSARELEATRTSASGPRSS